jgi:hypothetical protein
MTKRRNDSDDELLDTLQEAVTALSEMSGEEREAHAEGLEHTEGVLAYAELIIQDSDRGLVPASVRDEALQALTAVRDNPAMALQPPTDSDKLLEALARFPASRGRDAQQATAEIAERFQRSSSQRLRVLEGEAGETQAKIEERHGELDQRIDGLTTSLESRAGEIDQRVTDINTSLDGARTGVDALLREQQERFAQRDQEQDASLSELRESHSNELEEIRKVQEVGGGEHLAKMEALRGKAEGFLNVIANTGMASAFQDRADRDERHAGRYRVATIILGLVAVALAAALVVVGEKGVEYAFVKLGVVTTMLVVAGFTASHARRKQNAAERWREFELKLSGFGAVLETLVPETAEEEQRWLFRELFASRGTEEPPGILPVRLRRIQEDGERDAA